MKTSPHQFDLLITYMEQHGDLTKPSSNAQGRISTIQHWEKLTSILNSDGSGDAKSTDKWKKVWSDYKNNTKKKAARLHRAASGTGGGQALAAKLSDFEQRVLNLIGVQVATGLAIEEAGLPLVGDTNPVENTLDYRQSCVQVVQETQEVAEEWAAWNEPGPSNRPHVAPPLTASQIHDSDFLDGIEELHSPVPFPAASPVPEQQPARAGQTTPQRRPRGNPTRFARRSPRRPRPARQTNNELAAQHFLASDTEWRQFLKQQHQDKMELKREQNRVREMQVQAQREWQTRSLDILERIVDKFCGDRN